MRMCSAFYLVFALLFLLLPKALLPQKKDPPNSEIPQTVRVYLHESETCVTLDLETYVAGVVLAEMPVSFGAEALRAQAVAARSFALWALDNKSPAEGHGGAALCDSPAHCCAYLSREEAEARWDAEAVASLWQQIEDAVRATQGLLMTYEDKPICAVWHASSAGRTESAAVVWGGDVPYLQSVSTPEAQEPETIRITGAAFAEKLCAGQTVSRASLCGPISGWIRSVLYDEAGRMKEATIGDATLTGGELRALLGLPSTAFSLYCSGDGFLITYAGHGHGVGMSQYGAAAFAQQGMRFEEILQHYYTGVTLQTLVSA